MPKKRPVRKAAAPAAPPARTISSAFELPAAQIERALVTGESSGLLQDYFGPDAYTLMRDLARDASTRSVRGGQRVFILPGIMGSRLARKVLAFEDILWLNPAEIALGRLTALKLDGAASAYHEAGVILLAYLKLKLRLRSSGFDAEFFDYDWRQSLTVAGARLAEAIRNDAAPTVSLVAHSMGGLVARAALASVNAKVPRIVMLGTPNYGSFAPVEVLRGTYGVVQQIARLDQFHNAEELSGQVFNSFPGLYEMLPAPGKFSAVNLYDPSAWPTTGPQPRPSLLAGVKPVIDKLASADSRFFLVAGVNQDTVIGVHRKNGEFAFDVSPDGDGTVPLAFARLAGIPETQTYYVEEAHGSLPNNALVEAAVIDLLSTGSTSTLPTTRPASTRAVRTISESDARELASQGVGTGQLGSADYRHLLDAVAAPVGREKTAAAAPTAVTSPAALAAVVAAGPGGQQFQHLVVGRRRQRRIEITLALGSITEVDCPAYVLGIFRNVAPSGAAKAIDERLEGAITEFSARRMFSGDVGEIFTVPAHGKRLPADMVLFAGLGPFDTFNADVQQLVAENVLRVLVRSRVNDFATILIGAGSGQSTASVLQNLLVGFLRGAHDADPQQRFRGITLCETDAARYAEMKTELFRLTGTSLFEDVELTLDEIELPAPAAAAAGRVLRAGPEPVYLIVRQEGDGGDHLHFRASILGSGMKAAVVSAAREVSTAGLQTLLHQFDQTVGPGSNVEEIHPLGQQFADLILPAEICTVLESMQDRHLVVVHDAPAARIPWETLTLKPKGAKQPWSPAVGAGLSRRYLADNLPIATWLEQRRADPSLQLLLVVNPLGDLAGAEEEAKRIRELAAATAAIEVTELANEHATKPAILAKLRTGKFDVVHYAGHAFFDPRAPSQSGLICAGQERLRGPDLIGISSLPFLVFFNACEAARVRGRATPAVKPSAGVEQSVGVAEGLMRGGVANYMSTYWPVGDQAAMTFATTFYKGLISGSPIGSALLDGRTAVLKLGSRDWADYVLYGSYDFVLKQR